MELKFVTFKLQDDEYGFDIDSVQEVRKMRKIVYVPEVPGFVEGVIKLRGRVIPVVNLRMRFGIARKEYEKSTRIIVVNVEEHTLGVIVDSVEEVITLPEQSIDHPDSVLRDAAFLGGVGKVPGRMVLIVDIAKLLTLKEKELLQAVPGKVKAGREKNG